MEDALGIGGFGGSKLPHAMTAIAEEGRGAVFLFRQVTPKLINPEEEGPRIVKNTGLGAQMMSTLGLHELILLTDAPDTRYLGIDAYGISIVGTRPLKKG